MARFPEAEPILKAAETWRDRCLLADGSVFTDERLWTRPHLDDLNRHFVQNLDYGDEGFFTKLEKQLAPASPGAKKLVRIPPDSGHRFRLISATCSNPFRPPVPGDSGRPFRQIPATRIRRVGGV